jgi:hypothetical protein
MATNKAMRPAIRPATNTVAPIAQETSSKAINSGIAEVKTGFGKINDLVQETALAIIIHASLYGDCTGAARLLDAMPKSSRRGLVQTFFGRYSPIAVHLDTKTKKMKANLRKEDSKSYAKFDIDGARANKWYELPEADKEPEILTIEDFKSKAERFIAQMKKMAADTEHVAEADRKVVAETVAKLEPMLKVFESDEPLKF